MSKLSIIIPSRNEIYLERTISDILEKAAGEVEIIAVLDGYWPNPAIPDKPGLSFLHRGKPMGMRAAVRDAGSIAKGDFIMKVDAHCMFAEGFDEVLKAECGQDQVVVPRRYSLDPRQWKIRDDSPEPVDYEYFIYPRKYDPPSLHGFHWDQRTAERKDIPIDETMSFQGSCYIMKTEHFRKHGFLTVEGYEGLPQQEAEEVGLTTWFSGGNVITCKRTWYAHWHKSTVDGRGYFLGRSQTHRCYEFSYRRWVHEHRPQFIKLIEKFWPVPGWPDNWQEKIYR